MSHCQPFFDTSYYSFGLLSPSRFVNTMLISDIRMKSRGVSLPNNRSAACQLAEHTEQHPGITKFITMSTLSFSLIIITPAISVSLTNFLRNYSILCILFFVYLNLGSSNHNTASSTEEVSRGVAVEKLEGVKKWGINTYKVSLNEISDCVQNHSLCSALYRVKAIL